MAAGNETATLAQNVPIPFGTTTRIGIFLPQTVSNARLYVYNMQGAQIRSFNINDRGNTHVTIEGYSLEAGMYLYTLVADGKEVDTKKMILRSKFSNYGIRLINPSCLPSLFVAILYNSKKVDNVRAEIIAKNWGKQKMQKTTEKKIEHKKIVFDGDTLLHIFNFEDGGFVIVPFDDGTYPVLGYSYYG